MKSIELIVFDLGKVLIDFDFQKVIKALQKHTPKTGEEIHQFFLTTPLWDQYERGKISSKDFFHQLSREVGLKGLSFEEFKPLWCDIFTEKHDTVALLKKLKGRYKLAMLSNVNEMHWLHVKGKHDFMQWFDIPVASYAVGLRKPEAAIYHHLLKQAGVTADKAIFTDDLIEHITAAHKIGMKAHHFTTAEQLAKDWAELLQ